jgi:hypothetical protein
MLTPLSKPQLFSAVIDTCDVLEDDGESVLRDVKFKDGHCSPHFPTDLELTAPGGGVGMGPVRRSRHKVY